jgi:hypothetical protein
MTLIWLYNSIGQNWHENDIKRFLNISSEVLQNANVSWRLCLIFFFFWCGGISLKGHFVNWKFPRPRSRCKIFSTLVISYDISSNLWQSKITIFEAFSVILQWKETYSWPTSHLHDISSTSVTWMSWW